MCGRFALTSSKEELIEHFGLDDCQDFFPRYNIAPSTEIPTIRRDPQGRRVLHLLRWGLVPQWTRDPSIGKRLGNARCESVAAKPSFRDAFRRRRCLIPASGYFECKALGKGKQPYYVSLRSGEPMALAGLWESWKAEDGSLLRTTCILTCGPNALMRDLHDRMPVLLDREHWGDWLEAPADQVRELLQPYPDIGLQAWPVSQRVNRTQEDDADLITPIAIAEGA